MILKYFGISNAENHVDLTIKAHHKEDETTLKKFVETNNPDYIIVSINSIDARRILVKLRKLFGQKPFPLTGDNIIPYFKSI